MQKNEFPWMSAISLLYPIGGTLSMINTPANTGMVIGAGLANLGYLLFVAGIFAGTFRIFGLKKRWQVFLLAIIAFISGTILTNIGYRVL